MSANQSLPDPQLFSRLWRHIKPRRRAQFFALLLLVLFASFAEIVSIGAVLPFLAVLSAPDRLSDHAFVRSVTQTLGLDAPKDLLLPLTAAFAAATLFAGSLRVILVWVQTRLGHSVGADFSIGIYRRTLYQPYINHVARNSSEIISAISNKTNSVVHETLLPALVMLSSGCMLCIVFLGLFIIDPLAATAAVLGVGSIYSLVILGTRGRVARDGQRISIEQRQVIKALQEGLGGIRDVLIDGTQEVYCDIYRRSDLPLRRATANIQIIAIIPRYGIEALSMVFIAILAFLLAGRSEGVSNAIPILGVLALGAQRLLPFLQQVYSSWTTLCGGQASLRDVLDLVNQELPDYADSPPTNPVPFLHSITLRGISFRYTAKAPWVLKGVNLTIPKGSRIGIIGPSGSGKSTLLDIIMALLHPTCGQLEVDGVTITDGNHRAWQAHIAHVPQAIFLADTTIAENIAFGVPYDRIEHKRLRESAQKAQLAQTIESWESEYHTRVGERGVQLSGGQRQRIGIARALYKQAEVIVFDEATSALDNCTESAVMQAIENLSETLTLLIVAHRLTTLAKCTHIVELDAEGRIGRVGSYQEIVG